MKLRVKLLVKLLALWHVHEEGLLYMASIVIYISLGTALGSIVLNWIVGPLFPLLVVHVVPTSIRRWLPTAQ